ncbi:O-antigen ligase family protein, partial [Vibrio sp. FNV 38]|nr:O-antigen ligase family protein [Vibrio sp. FNV 38]
QRIDKCINGLFFLLPTTAFLGHKFLVINVVLILLLSLTKVNKTLRVDDKFKPLIFAFLLTIPLSIPHVILDQGRMAALDVPTRYFIVAILTILVSQVRLSIDLVYKSFMFSSVVAFILYPVYCGLYLGVYRYYAELFGKHIYILAVAYYSIVGMLVCACAVCSYVKQKNSNWAWLAAGASILFFITAFMSGSKVLLVALPILFILIIITLYQLERKTKRKAFTLGAIVAIVSVLSFPDTGMYKRIERDVENINVKKKTSTNERIEMLKSGYYTFIAAPIFGMGYEKRKEFNNTLFDEGVIYFPYLKDGKHSLHNEYINALAKKGIVGFILLSLLYLAPIYCVYKQREENQDVFLLISVFVGTFVCIGFTQAPLFGSSTSTYYAIITLFILLSLRRVPISKT